MLYTDKGSYKAFILSSLPGLSTKMSAYFLHLKFQVLKYSGMYIYIYVCVCISNLSSLRNNGIEKARLELIFIYMYREYAIFTLIFMIGP